MLNAARQPLLDALEEEAEAAGCDSSSKMIMLCENGGAPKVWLARSEGGRVVKAWGPLAARSLCARFGALPPPR